MLIDFHLSQTSIVLRVKIFNSSVSNGSGLTGLTSASSGLIISTIADNESSATVYTQAGSTIETISTLGTYAAPTATKCRFKELDSTNHKGIYELQIADARFAVSSSKSVLISISGATNAAECDVVIPLRSIDPYDAVRMGLTALPAVASGSAGAVVTSGTGTGQISLSSGAVTAGTVTDKSGYSLSTPPLTTSETASAVWDAITAGYVSAGSFGLALGSLGDPWNVSLPGAYTIGTAGNILGNVATSANMAAALWQDATPGDFTVPGSIGKCLFTGGNAPGASGGLPTVDANNAVKVQSGTGANQISLSSGAVTAGTVSDKTGYSLSTSQTFNTSGSVGSVTGSVGSVTSPVTAGTVSDKTGYSLGASQTFSTTGSIGGITGVTTINANLGTTQPINFTGTGGSALVKGDMIDAASTPVTVFTGTAQGPGTGNNQIQLASGETVNPLGRIIGLDDGQSAYCSAYNASTKTATVVCSQGTGGNWITGQNPTSATRYYISEMAPALSAAGAVTAGTVGDKTGYTLGTSQTFSTTGSVGSVTGNVGGNVGGNVTGNVLGNVAGSVNSVTLAPTVGGYATNEDPATLVWNALSASFNTANTMGAKVNAAASAGDPWSTAVPGAYGAGTAGNVLGTNLNATITSRLAGTAVPPNFSVLAIAPGAGTVTVGANNDKAGYALASNGLDAIATSAPTGPAATFPQMIIQTWRRFFKKSTLTSTELQTFADDGLTVVTTQSAGDDGTTQTLGPAV